MPVTIDTATLMASLALLGVLLLHVRLGHHGALEEQRADHIAPEPAPPVWHGSVIIQKEIQQSSYVGLKFLTAIGTDVHRYSDSESADEAPMSSVATVEARSFARTPTPYPVDSDTNVGTTHRAASLTPSASVSRLVTPRTVTSSRSVTPITRRSGHGLSQAEGATLGRPSATSKKGKAKALILVREEEINVGDAEIHTPVKEEQGLESEEESEEQEVAVSLAGVRSMSCTPTVVSAGSTRARPLSRRLSTLSTLTPPPATPLRKMFLDDDNGSEVDVSRFQLLFAAVYSRSSGMRNDQAQRQHAWESRTQERRD